MENKLRQQAKELLESGQVGLVIGYEDGSMPFKSTPCFASTAEDAERLVWNPTCVNNLAVYLPGMVKKGKVAVVIKPCDGKSVVELIKENQIKRDDVVTIVVPCPGVLSNDALAGIDPRTVRKIEWKNDSVAVTTDSGEISVPRDKAFMAKCQTCTLTDPAVTNIKIGESPARNPLKDKRAALEEYEKMSTDERRAFWTEQFSKCIRCYACRQACPGCYCNECFVDKNGQVWALKSTDATANWFFHMTRAMHLAGRCIGCSECERACPMDIPLGLIGKGLEREVAAMFGGEAGSDPDALPVLGDFNLDKDPDPCPE